MCHRISSGYDIAFYQMKLEWQSSEIPPDAPWLPILVIHIWPQVETRQSQSYIFFKIAKNYNSTILQEIFHMTHLLKLLYKMDKCEMDPTRIVGATEQTRDAGRMDGQTETNIPSYNFVVQGYNDHRLPQGTSSTTWTIFVWRYDIKMEIYIYISPKQFNTFKLNSLRPRWNRCHFADDIFKYILVIKIYWFWLKFHWSLFTRVQLTIYQRCHR